MDKILVDKSVLEQALEALTTPIHEQRFGLKQDAIVGLSDALAQQEQEPVAFADRISFDQAMKSGKGHDVWPEAGDYEARTGRKLRVLYTHPPRREWQGLRNKEIVQIVTDNLTGGDWVDVARAIEDALKVKNNR
jgi:hypothetical protein